MSNYYFIIYDKNTDKCKIYTINASTEYDAKKEFSEFMIPFINSNYSELVNMLANYDIDIFYAGTEIKCLSKYEQISSCNS